MPRQKQSYDRQANALSFRFFDACHEKLVREAAKAKGTSLNGWIVQVTLEQAKKQLRLK
jgi:uncharacterized protein (DUF1778 family)